MDQSLVKKDILAALTYFDLFNYPLRKTEIFHFLAHCSDRQQMEDALNSLMNECLVFRTGSFYSISDNDMLAQRRSRGNERAALLMKKASRVAALIARFPFVKGVAVSGSLSKHFADEEADIDFFIITAANRLWIARSFLHLLKKIAFLFKREHLFCMNYFIDEAGLEISEKNIYTAVEIATLLPLRGAGIFEAFFHQNLWVRDYFPNKEPDFSMAPEQGRTGFVRMAERMKGVRAGNRLDDYLMNLTARRWNAKTIRGSKDTKGLVLGMGVGKHFSKPNPANFQQCLLKRYEKSLAENYRRFELSAYF